MIFSHMSYCLTSWDQAGKTVLDPIERLYKQSLKVLDKKPKSYHHCGILTKYQLLSWENLMKYADIVLVYKILQGLAPPPLREFVKINPNSITRAGGRGDCVIPLRISPSGQSAFSY